MMKEVTKLWVSTSSDNSVLYSPFRILYAFKHIKNQSHESVCMLKRASNMIRKLHFHTFSATNKHGEAAEECELLVSGQTL